MKKHYARLKFLDRRGASALIALLVFFLAALSGTVALTMSTSNAGRFSHVKDDQQAYLSVASAAELILSRLEGTTITFRSTKESFPQNTDEIETHITTSHEDLFLTDPRSIQKLKDCSLQGADNASAAAEPSDVIGFYLSVPSAQNMGKVYVGISIQGAEFLFRLWSVNGDNTRDYHMTMRVLAAYQGRGTSQFMQDTTTDSHFYRDMTFDTTDATYAIEKNVSAGGAA